MLAIHQLAAAVAVISLGDGGGDGHPGIWGATMAKYRKKPVVIDAFRWTGGPDQQDDPEWIVAAIGAGTVTIASGAVYLTIHTLEGNMIADKGDYIIKGIANELYPCKADIFAATYDPVE